jgi:hypothetical protein
MPDVLQMVHPYTFLHVPNQSLSNMHMPWTWDFFGAHILKPNWCLCKNNTGLEICFGDFDIVIVFQLGSQ